MNTNRPSVHDDLIGQTVRGIKILRYGPYTKAYKRTYIAVCHCGEMFNPTCANFKENKTKQCGKCAKKKQITTGVSLRGWKGRLWSKLNRMHQKGEITLCERWQDIDTFCHDMKRPSAKHRLWIKDKNKVVDKKNVEWLNGGWNVVKLDCYYMDTKTTFDNVMCASRATGVNHMSIRTKLWENGVAVVKKHLFVPAGTPITETQIQEELQKAKRVYKPRQKKEA